MLKTKYRYFTAENSACSQPTSPSVSKLKYYLTLNVWISTNFSGEFQPTSRQILTEAIKIIISIFDSNCNNLQHDIIPFPTSYYPQYNNLYPATKSFRNSCQDYSCGQQLQLNTISSELAARSNQ